MLAAHLGCILSKSASMLASYGMMVIISAASSRALIVHGTQVAGVLSTAIYPLGFSVLRERSGGYDAPLMLCAGFSVVLAGAILCCFRKPSRPRRDK